MGSDAGQKNRDPPATCKRHLEPVKNLGGKCIAHPAEAHDLSGSIEFRSELDTLPAMAGGYPCVGQYRVTEAGLATPQDRAGKHLLRGFDSRLEHAGQSSDRGGSPQPSGPSWSSGYWEQTAEQADRCFAASAFRHGEHGRSNEAGGSAASSGSFASLIDLPLHRLLTVLPNQLGGSGPEPQGRKLSLRQPGATTPVEAGDRQLVMPLLRKLDVGLDPALDRLLRSSEWWWTTRRSAVTTFLPAVRAWMQMSKS